MLSNIYSPHTLAFLDVQSPFIPIDQTRCDSLTTHESNRLAPSLSQLAFLTWLLHHQPEQTEPTGDNLQLVSLIIASDQSSVCASKRKAWLLLAWMVADCCLKCFSSHDNEYFVF